MKTKILHILGNLKGGVISPEQAYEAITEAYTAEIQKIRYPGEPKLYIGDKTDIIPIFVNEKTDDNGNHNA